MTYRKDIDFLRALAAVGIFLYHLSVPGLSGGYVFLDLFFVITGYLISSIVIAKIQAGTFSVKRFYINRFFRLFPALITVIICTLAAGYFILSPVHYKGLGGSAVLGTLSFSNVYFWQQVDYFDIGKYLKPLLHTWSLGAEEQFYFIWPALLILAFSFKNTVRSYYVCLTTLFVLSLGISIYWSYSESMSSGAYYLLPSRMFEFTIGAFIASFGMFKRLEDAISARASDALFAAGLVLIAGAVLTLKESFAFPGYLALIPCLGGALCILGGTKSKLADILSNRVTVYIGQISYSLYLVHWPLIVFYKYGRDEALGYSDMALIFGLAVGAATLLHILVEQPFRQKTPPFFAIKNLILPRKRSGTLSVIALILTLLIGAHIYQSDGMRYRLNTDMEAAFHAAEQEYQARQPLIRAPDCHYNNAQESFDDYIARFELCNPPKKLAESAHNILLIGDSHGADIYAALSLNRPDINVIQLTKAGCYAEDVYSHANKNCGALMTFAKDFAKDNTGQLDAVIFKIRGHILYEMDGPEFKELRAFLIAPAQRYLESISAQGVPVIWLGPNVEYTTDYRQILEKSNSVKDALAYGAQDRRWAELDALDANLEARFKGSPVTYISSRAICGGDPCPLTTPDGVVVTPDYGHWGASGADYMGGLVLASSPLSEVLKEAR